MGVPLEQPKFPVVDGTPSFGAAVGNFGAADYANNVRGPSMYAAATLGAIGGFMLAYQASAGRLMGFKPNDAEVARLRR
eukprot:SM000053S17496  [mRNA]  locus=s53:645402:645872:- [translate_table: standard]